MEDGRCVASNGSVVDELPSGMSHPFGNFGWEMVECPSRTIRLDFHKPGTSGSSIFTNIRQRCTGTIDLNII